MKRFTDTEKWFDEWFRNLPPYGKCFWFFVCDRCDNAGVWKADLTLASFCVGAIITDEAARQFLGGRIIDLGNGKWFVPKFIGFQYGELNPACRPHQAVLETLKAHGIGYAKGKLTLSPELGKIPHNQLTLQGLTDIAHIPYAKGINTLQEKDQDQDKEKDQEKESDSVELPAGFPKTQTEATAHASFVGCTDDFAILVWNKALSRGGRDAKDVPIRAFRNYLATEWTYERDRKEREKHAANKNSGRNGAPNRNDGTFNSDPSKYAKCGKVG